MSEEEPPRKKGFWQSWSEKPGQHAVAEIMAFTLFAGIIIIAIMAGVAIMLRKYELTGGIADMFKIVLGGIAGSLATYIGVKRNGEK